MALDAELTRRVIRQIAGVLLESALKRRPVPTGVPTDARVEVDNPEAVVQGPMSEGWRAVAIEEYKGLRQESLAAIQNQHTTVRYSLATFGILFGFALQEIEKPWAELIFLFALPGFAVLSYAVYAIEFGRMVRVGRYIESMEAKFTGVYGTGAAGWEGWLNTARQGKQPRLFLYWVVPGIYFGAAFVSVSLYVWSVWEFAGPSERQTCRLLIALATWGLLIVVISLRLRNFRNSLDSYFPPALPSD